MNVIKMIQTMLISIGLMVHGNVFAADQVRVRFGSFEDQGSRRTMEDALKIEENFIRPGDCFFGVFDGHGGSRASTYAATNFPRIVAQSLGAEIGSLTGEQIQERLEAATLALDTEILQQSWDDGSCAIVASLLGHDLYIINVGDSRAVLSSAGTAIDLSRDQKPGRADEVERIFAADGEISGWPFSVRSRLRGPRGYIAISRALGDKQDKEYNKGLIATPEIEHRKIVAADQFLILACDGIWDVFTSQEAVDLVAQSLAEDRENVQAAAQRLCQDAIRERRSSDNCSAIVVVFDHSQGSSQDNSGQVVDQEQVLSALDLDSRLDINVMRGMKEELERMVGLAIEAKMNRSSVEELAPNFRDGFAVVQNYLTGFAELEDAQKKARILRALMALKLRQEDFNEIKESFEQIGSAQ